jgi:hypothetical protein
MTDDDDHHVTMQPRCPRCLTEQYAPAVVEFSYGEIPCQSCGWNTRTMTRTEYHDALTATQERHERQRTRPRIPRARLGDE